MGQLGEVLLMDLQEQVSPLAQEAVADEPEFQEFVLVARGDAAVAVRPAGDVTVRSAGMGAVTVGAMPIRAMADGMKIPTIGGRVPVRPTVPVRRVPIGWA